MLTRRLRTGSATNNPQPARASASSDSRVNDLSSELKSSARTAHDTPDSPGEGRRSLLMSNARLVVSRRRQGILAGAVMRNCRGQIRNAGTRRPFRLGLTKWHRTAKRKGNRVFTTCGHIRSAMWLRRRGPSVIGGSKLDLKSHFGGSTMVRWSKKKAASRWGAPRVFACARTVAKW